MGIYESVLTPTSGAHLAASVASASRVGERERQGMRVCMGERGWRDAKQSAHKLQQRIQGKRMGGRREWAAELTVIKTGHSHKRLRGLQTIFLFSRAEREEKEEGKQTDRARHEATGKQREGHK